MKLLNDVGIIKLKKFMSSFYFLITNCESLFEIKSQSLFYSWVDNETLVWAGNSMGN